MRRCADDMLRATPDDQQVAVLYAADELHALAALLFVDGLCQLLVQVVYEHAGVVRLQVSAVVGYYFPIFK